MRLSDFLGEAKLCPHCLVEVDDFTQDQGAGGETYYKCPQCNAVVPVGYVRDYQTHPPIVFSLVGFRKQGKTVFLASLIHELDGAATKRAANEWPNFSYASVERDGLRLVRGMQKQLERRKLPDATDKVFKTPAILKMEDVPVYGKCQLLAYDTSGESLREVSELKQYVGYLYRVPTVVLLVSLGEAEGEADQETDDELPHSASLDKFLTIYAQAIAEIALNDQSLSGNFHPLKKQGQNLHPLKKQTLLVVLTKADRLHGDQTVPLTISNFLWPEQPAPENGSASHFRRLEELSDEIENWLEQDRKFGRFVRQIKKEFREVRYCIISATGSEPVGDQLLDDVEPRGVLSVLLWVMRLQRPRTPPPSDEPPVKAAGQTSGHAVNESGTRWKDYLRVLDDPKMVKFCQDKGREPERMVALKQLKDEKQRSTDLAKQLVEDFDQFLKFRTSQT